MALYENTFIGSFLYGLGIQIGASSAQQPRVTGVDLLQQTPLDSPLADLLIHAPDYVSIIEFKRRENRSEKESEKRAWLSRNIGVSVDPGRLQRISRAMHFQIDLESVGKSLVVRLRPYLDEDEAGQTIDLANLCRWFADAMGKSDPTPSPQDRAEYLAFLRTTHGKDSASGGGGSVLIVAAKDGLIRHAVVDDLRDFFRTPNQLLALQRQLDAARGALHERDRTSVSKGSAPKRLGHSDRAKDREYSGPEL